MNFPLVLNAVMLLLTGALASKLGIDFHGAGFGAGFWGAIVVGIVSMALSMLLPDDSRHRVHQVEG